MIPDSNLMAEYSRPTFNEQEWLKLLFLLADTQTWLDDLATNAFMQLPVEDKRRFLRKTYFLTPIALVHILEKHYYKISRYPQASKFIISLPDILHYIRLGADIVPKPCLHSRNFKRTIDAEKIIGLNKEGLPVTLITIVTDPAGRIISAYPDNYNAIETTNKPEKFENGIPEVEIPK